MEILASSVDDATPAARRRSEEGLLRRRRPCCGTRRGHCRGLVVHVFRGEWYKLAPRPKSDRHDPSQEGRGRRGEEVDEDGGEGGGDATAFCEMPDIE